MLKLINRIIARIRCRSEKNKPWHEHYCINDCNLCGYNHNDTRKLKAYILNILRKDKNLCDTCKRNYPTCNPADIIFNPDTHKDNIIGCTAYIKK